MILNTEEWGLELLSHAEDYNAPMQRPLMAFDIETVPDPELGRRIYGLEGADLDVMEAMLSRRLVETGDRSSFFAPPFHRIVMLSIAWFDPNEGRFRLETPAGVEGTERAHLRSFYRLCADRPAPRLITWNGRGFDLPVVRYRSMVWGIQARGFHTLGRERRGGFWDRFGDDHVDLMDTLTGFGASPRVRLDDWSRILRLPGKTVTQGGEVFRHVAAGENQLVATYCELDALNTLLLYLAWRFHTGAIETTELHRAVSLIRCQLRSDPRPDVTRFASALEGWPRVLEEEPGQPPI